MTETTPVTERQLRAAAQAALHAPSIFNTQPWRWVVAGRTLSLYADRARQLLVADPEGRLLTVSCGAALHHARLAVTAGGRSSTVRVLPDPADPDLLAVIEPGEARTADVHEYVMYHAISQRRTDRRAFTAEPVADAAVQRLAAAAEAEGAHLAVLREHQVGALAAVAAQAGELELADPAYRRELARWTVGSVPGPANGEGVPAATAVAPGARRVPVRDFAVPGAAGLDAGEHTDAGALYAILFTDEDTPEAWLRTGQALSSMLLTATVDGLAGAPISDVTETALTRERLRGLLAGVGLPQLALRVGHPPQGTPPASPRRSLGDIVTVSEN
ncbi:Acg family FMN-binding oxidoreductase [Hamadaea tsunoensis]|uniref:Acg family FMN-binding oxidoreductase n=1 Tax=Hamadaea tsunoensis TaxID=53368 RepID=UPI000401DCD3|nr:nitroreductase family protein [Hamadaea tsunoensis]